jgi:uncharacterized protein YfaQ (DUF2300 family)
VKMRLVIAALLLAGCSKADPAYEKSAIADYPTRNPAATTVYFHRCKAPDAAGKAMCYSCGNTLVLDADGLFVGADNNEQTLEGNPPEVKVTAELSHQYTRVANADLAKERAKGAAAFEKYLTGLFEADNAWCAGLGGERHDLKNEIAAAARGPYGARK